MRTCTICTKSMFEGFIFDDGCGYYCSEKCLNQEFENHEKEQLFENDTLFFTDWFGEEFPEESVPFIIDHEQAKFIDETRSPLGVFYIEELDGSFTGIYNSSDDFLTRNFHKKKNCFNWLMDKLEFELEFTNK